MNESQTTIPPDDDGVLSVGGLVQAVERGAPDELIGQQPTPAAPSSPVTSAPPPARFTLYHPAGSWEGEVAGVKFVRGVGHTDSTDTAHGLMSRGIVPIDSQTGQPGFDLDAEGFARLEQHARAEWKIEQVDWQTGAKRGG